MLCGKCNEREVRIRKWGVCLCCYQKHYAGMRNNSQDKTAMCQTTVKKYDSDGESEFIKNFFLHKDWQYQPTTFKLGSCQYTPDFYDGARNCFIEVAGTRQAYHENKYKYELFREIFPSIKLEIRLRDGSLFDENRAQKKWKSADNELTVERKPILIKIDDRMKTGRFDRILKYREQAGIKQH